MRNIIINLIDKVIVPKYGQIDFYVVRTNDLHMPGLGYEVVYHFEKKPSDKLSEEIISDTKMLLQMLGLGDVVGLNTGKSIYVSGMDSTK